MVGSRALSRAVPRSEQDRLRAAVVPEDTERWQREPGWAGLQRVGGVDLSYVKGGDGSACASLVVLGYPGLEVPAGRGHGGTLRLVGGREEEGKLRSAVRAAVSRMVPGPLLSAGRCRPF